MNKRQKITFILKIYLLAAMMIATTTVNVNAQAPVDSTAVSVSPSCVSTIDRRLCTRADEALETLRDHQSLSDNLHDLIYNEANTHIRVSSYFLGDEFIDQLVEAFLQNAFRISLIADRESVGVFRDKLSSVSEGDLAALVETISLDIPQRQLPISWHAKILLIERDNGIDYTLVTTSDNFRLRRGYEDVDRPEQISQHTLNFENYHFHELSIPEDITVIERHLCFFTEAMKINGNNSLVQFSDNLQSCLLQHRSEERSFSEFGYFLPSENLEFLQDTAFHFGASNNIFISSYNLNSIFMIDLVATAVRNGSSVYVLTDDDGICGDLSIEDIRWVELAISSGADVRFMPTGSILNSNSRYHRKELIFDSSEGPVAFSGSMNFTCAGACRNTEVMYKFEGSLGEVFLSEFQRNWHDLSVSRDELICE